MSSFFRIGGLASGMDIDQMVSDLMKVQRMRVDKKKQDKQIAEWQREDYRGINNSLRALRDSAFNMKLQGTYLAKKATSSNETVVTATASPSASAGVYKVTVQQLADGVSRGSQAALPVENAGGTTRKLSEQFTGLDPTVTFELAGSKGNKAFSFDTGTKTIYDVVSEINSAKIGITASYDSTLNRFYLTADSTGSAAKIQVVSDSGNFLSDPTGTGNNTLKLNLFANIVSVNTLNATDGATLLSSLGLTGSAGFTLTGSASRAFNFNDTNTINDVVTQINNANLGITAGFDTSTKKFTLSATGGNSKIQVTEDNNNFISDSTGAGTGIMKLNLKNGTANLLAAGANAKINFADTNNLEFSTNTFTINGMTITAKKADPDTSIDVTVASDIDSVYNSIKSFIDLYNTTIEKVNTELSEERYRDYLPLTDEQREGLGEEQVKKWEEKARSGLLKSDTVLSGCVYKMRATMSTVVLGVSDTKYDTLTEIGIKTGDYSEKGKLYIDEAKLKDALAKNPQAVMEVFTNSPDSYDQKGIAARLYDDLTATLGSLLDKAGADYGFGEYDDSILGKKITNFNKEIDSLEKRLAQIEDRYWRQFTAMEKALNQMNSQSAWLAQQFSGGK